MDNANHYHEGSTLMSISATSQRVELTKQPFVPSELMLRQTSSPLCEFVSPGRHHTHQPDGPLFSHSSDYPTNRRQCHVGHQHCGTQDEPLGLVRASPMVLSIKWSGRVWTSWKVFGAPSIAALCNEAAKQFRGWHRNVRHKFRGKAQLRAWK